MLVNKLIYCSLSYLLFKLLSACLLAPFVTTTVGMLYLLVAFEKAEFVGLLLISEA